MRRLRHDRRGATALLFAVSATALLGVVALAADGGLLYLVQQRAQSAADTAAIAAASAAETRTRDAALAAGIEVAGLNGFAGSGDTTLAVRNPPASGVFKDNMQAYEVEIRHRQPLAMAGALLGQPEGEIGVRAVAMLKGTTQVCLLALNGTVSVASFSKFSAQGCALGANSTGSGAVKIDNSGSFSAQGVVTAGTCSGCTNRNVTLAEGYQEQAPAIANPYARLNNLTAPNPPCTTTNPKDFTFNTRAQMPPYEQTGTAFCNQAYKIGSDSKVPLDAGTYIFHNASLTISSLSELTCDGCTFILVGTGTGTTASFSAENLSRFLCDNCTVALLGSSPGQVNFTSLSSARITAPRVNSYDPALNGMIIVRSDSGPTGSSSNPTLRMSSLSSIALLGGIYVPNGYTRITNMSAPDPSTCLPIVVGTLEIGQLSNFPFDVSGCPARNTAVPEIRVPRLVE
ncbi:pilus assembly protein TadG-related protein [Roseomonas sp. E05]|uniref:pilus assembly protein TadG-related protein n=1 Tax=Roseomonas sp. E05 TaxID=3046310 RepID=UPI0024B887EB|nr:pilus assembly protein TadG-related protein [Roseomonas sp. E05]MDJ0391284.1 pilus assembly protein TadG-related protein [Roseomonas sp. E05]